MGRTAAGVSTRRDAARPHARPGACCHAPAAAERSTCACRAAPSFGQVLFLCHWLRQCPDLKQTFGAKIPVWYTHHSCPIVSTMAVRQRAAGRSTFAGRSALAKPNSVRYSGVLRASGWKLLEYFQFGGWTGFEPWSGSLTSAHAAAQESQCGHRHPICLRPSFSRASARHWRGQVPCDVPVPEESA